MQIGSFFKALVSVATSDAKGQLPNLAAAAASIAANQGAANLTLQGASLLSAAVKLGPQIAQDEIVTLADVVALLAATAAKNAPAVTPASAAAAAIK